MKAGFNARGFTIIETMVVLAVTAILLLSVVLIIGGKTSEAQFTSTMNNLKSSLQQTADNVSNGNYPNSDKITCPAISPNQLTITQSTQGTNFGCTYLGIMLGFQLSPSSTSYSMDTIIGQECTAYTTFNNCITPTGSVTNENPTVGLISSQFLSSNISLNSISTTTLGSTTSSTYCLNTCPGNNFAPVIGFLASSAQASSSASSPNGLSPGSQQINPYSYNSKTNLLVNGAVSPLNEDSEIDLCFASNTTDESGKITLGGNSNSQTVVSLQIFGGKLCA